MILGSISMSNSKQEFPDLPADAEVAEQTLSFKELKNRREAMRSELPSMKELPGHIISLVHSGQEFSDILIKQGQECLWRRPSGWEPTGFGLVPSEEILHLLNTINPDWMDELGVSMTVKQRAEQHIPSSLDIGFDLDSSRLRINVAFEGGSTRSRRILLTIRRIPRNPPPFADLPFPVSFMPFVRQPQKGLLLVSGATGSGKTTTLASIINALLQERALHVVTIEDPIEYSYNNVRGVGSQREVGENVASFSEGLRGAIGSINKMMSFFGGAEESVTAKTLASVLLASVAQVMIPSRNRDRFIMVPEYLINRSAVTEHIADVSKHKNLETLFREGRLEGLAESTNSALIRGISESKFHFEDALAASYDPEDLKAKAQPVRSGSRI